VEKGCAQLDKNGAYSLTGNSTAGLMAGSSESEMARAAHIPQLYEAVQELRPTSQRP
jgi:hypothetical protein